MALAYKRRVPKAAVLAGKVVLQCEAALMLYAGICALWAPRHYAEMMIGREHRASLEAGSPTTNLLIALLQNYGAVIVCLAAMLHFALYEAGGAFLAKMVRGLLLGDILQLQACWGFRKVSGSWTSSNMWAVVLTLVFAAVRLLVILEGVQSRAQRHSIKKAKVQVLNEACAKLETELITVARLSLLHSYGDSPRPDGLSDLSMVHEDLEVEELHRKLYGPAYGSGRDHNE